jgi:aryl-alcohol dehydrogenase-like predicted oxidoreductase
METRKIGSLEVSLVGLGCNNFGGRIDEARTKEVVDAAIDAGITLFDTADVYGGGGRSEELLGAALGARRKDVVVATKFGMPMGEGKAGAAPDYVRAACDDSLRRLGVDVIDLYQQHAPDPSVPISETLGALDELVEAGKVRQIGCSNFTPEMIDEATAVSKRHDAARFVSVQNELSLLRRKGDAGLIDACERDDLGILPYLPLASGMLTGKYRRGEAPPEGTRLASAPEDRRARALSDRNFDLMEALESFATGRGHTLLELAMSWLAGLPKMASVIAGATSPAQVRTNAGAVSWVLTAADRAEIDRLTAT